VFFMAAVRKIKPRDIQPGYNHLPDYGIVVTGRPQCRNNFRLYHFSFLDCQAEGGSRMSAYYN